MTLADKAGLEPSALPSVTLPTTDAFQAAT